MIYTVISDKFSNHNLPIGATVTKTDAPAWSEGGDWYTQGGVGDEVAIDSRDLKKKPPRPFKVVVRTTCEVTRSGTYEIDLNEYEQWTSDPLTSKTVKEFIESHRDREEIEEEIWDTSSDVDPSAAPFVQIEKVIIP